MNEQEQNELLEASLKLAKIAENRMTADDSRTAVDAKKLIGIIQSHRPKPRLVEGWLCYHADGSRSSSEGMDYEPFKNVPNVRTAPVRKVTDPPKWDWWEADNCTIMQGDEAVAILGFNTDAERIADAHNAEMERLIAAWKGGE